MTITEINKLSISDILAMRSKNKNRGDIQINSRFVGNVFYRDHQDSYLMKEGLVFFNLTEEQDGIYSHYWGHYPKCLKNRSTVMENNKYWIILEDILGFGVSYNPAAKSLYSLKSPFGLEVDQELGISSDCIYFANVQGFELWAKDLLRGLRDLILKIEKHIFSGDKEEVLDFYNSLEPWIIKRIKDLRLV
jgi:hypothetical protein